MTAMLHCQNVVLTFALSTLAFPRHSFQGTTTASRQDAMNLSADEVPWLPSWDAIRSAYNLTHRWTASSSSRSKDESKTDAIARFQAVFLAGPLHIAKSLGEDAYADRIVEEYRTLTAIRGSSSFAAPRTYRPLTSRMVDHRPVGSLMYTSSAVEDRVSLLVELAGQAFMKICEGARGPCASNYHATPRPSNYHPPSGSSTYHATSGRRPPVLPERTTRFATSGEPHGRKPTM